MSKQKYFYLSLIIACVSLCCVFWGFFVTNKTVFAESEDGGTEITQYNITYLDSKAGTSSLVTTNPTIVRVEDFPVVLENPTETTAGYVFGYWGFNISASLPQTSDEKFELTLSDAELYSDASGNITIYAYWDLIEYSLKFEYSGVEYGAPTDPTGFEDSAKVTAETDIDLTKSEYKAKCLGHQFVGWYSDNTYTTEITRLTNVTKDITLYGKFSKLNYCITFADETLGYDDIPFRSGIDYPYDYTDSLKIKHDGLLQGKIPTKDGYSFEGWYTSPDCNNASILSRFQPLTSPVTLYAKWVKKPSPIWLYASLGACGLIAGGFVWWYFTSKRKLWS